MPPTAGLKAQEATTAGRAWACAASWRQRRAPDWVQGEEGRTGFAAGGFPRTCLESSEEKAMERKPSWSPAAGLIGWA